VSVGARWWSEEHERNTVFVFAKSDDDTSFQERRANGERTVQSYGGWRFAAPSREDVALLTLRKT
jgi:hypothetical protein